MKTLIYLVYIGSVFYLTTIILLFLRLFHSARWEVGETGYAITINEPSRQEVTARGCHVK